MKQKEEYPVDLNDTIKYFNNLDKEGQSSVLEDLKEIKAKFLDILSQKDRKLEVTFFQMQMNLATEARHQHMHEGPSASWVYASFTESLCLLFITKEYDLALSFLEEGSY